ncbi:MAG TPA: VCBS repeat-containing protein, partial [Candidatus Hydrogenedentes bacterium]|nr:VCBS repeat-containing protein [Candidatus Hydrogenedentota bacterium]
MRKESVVKPGTRGATLAAVVVIFALMAGVAQAQSQVVFNRTKQIALPTVGNTAYKATCISNVNNDVDTAPDLVVGYLSRAWAADPNIPSQFTIVWYRNDGTDNWPTELVGTWTSNPYNPTGFTAFNRVDILSDIAVADIDRDGLNDIVFCTHVEGILWWRRTGTSAWEANPRVIVGRNLGYDWHHNTRKLAVLDLDGDTDVDVGVVFGEGPSPTAPNTKSRIGFYYHNAVTPPTIPTTWSYVGIEDFNTLDFPVSIRAANVVGDARPELFICARANNRVRWYCGSTGLNGSLSYPTRLNIAEGSWYRPYDTAFGDVNQNGRLDLFVAQRGTAGSVASIRLSFNTNTADANNWVSLFNVDATRTPTDSGVRDDAYPIFLKSVDFDADGDADLFASFNRLDASPQGAATNGQVVYYENMNGAGTSWTQTLLPTGASGSFVA